MLFGRDSFRKKNIGKYIIGYELGKQYVQMSYLKIGEKDNTTDCTTSNADGCNDYINARMKCNTTFGAWYNYAAATAGTITGKENSNTQKYDICPKGWRLPKQSEQSDIANYSSAFSPVTGGRYTDGVISYPDNGTWWGSDIDHANSRHYLDYNGSKLTVDASLRYRGRYVRCIK